MSEIVDHKPYVEVIKGLEKSLESAIDQFRAAAWHNMSIRARELSKRYPDRIVTLGAGMGCLDLTISRKQTHHVDAYNRFMDNPKNNERGYAFTYSKEFRPRASVLSNEYLDEFYKEVYILMKIDESEYSPILGGEISFRNGEDVTEATNTQGLKM